MAARFEARGHAVTARAAGASIEPAWLEEAYDVVVDHWPRPVRSGFASWAASACGGAFLLTVVDGEPDTEIIAALLASGTDDVIARSAFEHHLDERILVIEHTLFRWAARKKAEAVTVRNVTEQPEAEECLRDLAENLSATLDSIGDAVITCNAAAVITRMNPVAEKLTAWTFADAKARPLDDIFKILDRETRAPVASPVARALGTGAVAPPGIHWILVRRDGTELPVADSCAPIKGADGVVRGAVLVFRDVSAEHRARDVEENARRQLAVAERTSSLGTLAAGAAHEIDNPLACVISNLDVSIEDIRALSDRPTAAERDELEEMLREARSGAERVRQIVWGLKTFSRSEDERREVLELRPVLELAAKMAATAIRHRARLVEDFGAIPLVEGDGARLGQVFINLLISAAQGLPDSQSETNEVRIATSTDAAGRAVIEIKDTGPGTPSLIRGRAFDPFYITSLVGLGTGLGLTVSQNIVNRMGGEVAVQREEGHGTTVRVVLPPAAVQQVPEVVDWAHPAVAEVSEVLVIDNEVALGTALRRVLPKHDVTVVAHAREALDLLATGRTFDVIFCALMMPEMSGMDFYDEASRGFPDAAERTVFVTEGAFTPVAAAFLARVANRQLEKPFAPETVRTLVHALGRARRGPSMSETIELRPKPDIDLAIGDDRDGREHRLERGGRMGRN